MVWTIWPSENVHGFVFFLFFCLLFVGYKQLREKKTTHTQILFQYFCIYQMKFSLLTAVSLNTIFYGTDRMQTIVGPRRLYAHRHSDKREHVWLSRTQLIERERQRKRESKTNMRQRQRRRRSTTTMTVVYRLKMRIFIQVCCQNGRASFHMHVVWSVSMPFIKARVSETTHRTAVWMRMHLKWCCPIRMSVTCAIHSRRNCEQLISFFIREKMNFKWSSIFNWTNS